MKISGTTLQNYVYYKEEVYRVDHLFFLIIAPKQKMVDEFY